MRRILPERVLGRAATTVTSVEGGDGADAVAYELDEFGLGLARFAVAAGFQDDEAARDLALEFVGDADDGAFGDVGVGGQGLFHAAGGQAVSGDVDDVVGAAHDEDIAVVVDVSAVAGQVVAGVGGEVGGDVPVVVLPERGQCAGRQREPHDDRAVDACGHRIARSVEDPDVPARQRAGGRPGLEGSRLDAHRVGDDGPAGLGLPPVVDHRDAQQIARPVVGLGIEALAGQEEVAQAGQVVARGERSPRVLLPDRPESGGCREHGPDPVLGGNAPELARVRGAHRLALVQHRRRAGQQGRVDDVRVADDPADVGTGEHRLARAHVVDGPHRPVEGDRVAAAVTHDSLGLSGRSGGVEDVEGVGCGDGNTVGRRRGSHQVGPVEIVRPQLGRLLRALQDHALLRLVGRELDRLVEQGLVRDDTLALDAAGGGDDHLGGRVIDAQREFARGEPAEDDRVHRADTCAGQHRDNGLGDHRHVDHHTVAVPDTEPRECSRESRNLVPQLHIGVGAPGVGHG
ncbi:hypothetical protein STAFG_2587 [Streptomyces afghaniensis 772]|uniref:Uncharacterized protein n=1 Tax=Streptomyces afghaniensis 772 TaxID=1283301 RepID=S4MLD6_9ACTN|nr:hypothetical protein STAFG_2587 [Streptomyces afghaniensis 772]